LAYRWHSCIGELDEKWTENVYHELFGKEAADVSMRELMCGLKKYDEHMPKDPMERPFAHLKRGEDGKFADDDLVKIMQTGVEEIAGMLEIPSILPSVFFFTPKSTTDHKYARCFRCSERPKMLASYLHSWYEASACLELRFFERIPKVLRSEDIRHI